MVCRRNILFFIGNGFDLNLGLKTSYRDFLSSRKIAKYIESMPENSIWAKLGSEMKKDRNSGVQLWADFEKYLGETIPKWSEVHSFSSLSGFVKDFESKLNDYLKEQIEQIDYSCANEIIEMLLTIAEISTDPPNISDYDLFFINANFTDTLDSFAVSAGISCDNIVHVHGRVDDEELFIGVDNEAQFDIRFRQNQRIGSLIKSEMRQHYGHEATINKWINCADEIIIFGMALGETDKTFWRIIEERAEMHRNCKLKIIDITMNRKPKEDRVLEIRNKFLLNSGLMASRYYDLFLQQQMINVILINRRLFRNVMNEAKKLKATQADNTKSTNISEQCNTNGNAKIFRFGRLETESITGNISFDFDYVGDDAIEWVFVNDNFYCTRNLIKDIDWIALNKCFNFNDASNYVRVEINGNNYRIRLPYGGINYHTKINQFPYYVGGITESNEMSEWDMIICNQANISKLPNTNNATGRHDREHNDFWDWCCIYSWCMEKTRLKDVEGIVVRGWYLSNNYYSLPPTKKNLAIGFRPVLELCK